MDEDIAKALREAFETIAREWSDEITRMRGAREEGRIEGKRKIINAMRKKGLTDVDIKKMIDPFELD